MKPMTKDNCDFPTLRKSGCVYVDKTLWLHSLATDPVIHLNMGKCATSDYVGRLSQGVENLRA